MTEQQTPDLTPQQVVCELKAILDEESALFSAVSDAAEAAKHFGIPNSEECDAMGECAQRVAVLTAALAAYQREQKRLWLEDQEIVAVFKTIRGGRKRWFVECPRYAPERLEGAMSWLRYRYPDGLTTADEARDAAAQALGFREVRP